MRKLFAFLFILTLFFPGLVIAEIVGKEVEYQAGDLKMKGFLAYDDSTEDVRPGVLVVHEWWGHNDYARKRAKMLAEAGYVALAVDMYGNGKQAAHPKDAGKFAGAVMKDIKVAKTRFLAALDRLKREKLVKKNKTAAIGYCFGGGVVLHMARMGVDLDSVASFHGSLAGKVKARSGKVIPEVLVFHGDADTLVPEKEVEAFKNEMMDANVKLSFFEYPGAKHSFTNPQADEFAKKFEIPVGYDKNADTDSWRRMLAKFKEIFKPQA